MMPDNKNLFLAIALSILVIVGWQYFLGAPQMEKGAPNGHTQAVSPFKRLLLRTIPELKTELDPVVNVFDPWARARGEYYDLTWKPRPGAESDDSFQK